MTTMTRRTLGYLPITNRDRNWLMCISTPDPQTMKIKTLSLQVYINNSKEATQMFRELENSPDGIRANLQIGPQHPQMSPKSACPEIPPCWTEKTDPLSWFPFNLSIKLQSECGMLKLLSHWTTFCRFHFAQASLTKPLIRKMSGPLILSLFFHYCTTLAYKPFKSERAREISPKLPWWLIC